MPRTLTEVQKEHLSKVRDLWQGKTLLAHGGVWTAEAREPPSQRRTLLLQQLELANALRTRLEEGTALVENNSKSSSEARKNIAQFIPDMNQLVVLTEALEGNTVLPERRYQEYNKLLEQGEAKRKEQVKHAKQILEDQMERMANPDKEWPNRTDLPSPPPPEEEHQEEAAAAAAAINSEEETNNNDNRVDPSHKQLTMAAAAALPETTARIVAHPSVGQPQPIHNLFNPVAGAPPHTWNQQPPSATAKRNATEMLKPPPPVQAPPIAPPIPADVAVWNKPGDLRNHALAAQQRYHPAAMETEESPREESREERKKKKKKKRHSYEEGLSRLPQETPPERVAAVAPSPPEPALPDIPISARQPLPPTDVVDVAAAAATAAAHSPRPAVHNNPPSSSHQKHTSKSISRHSPEDNKSVASRSSRASSYDANSSVPDMAPSHVGMPNRRSRRQGGPKKCHNCKLWQPSFLKCQYILETGCRCGKYYCFLCLEKDYKDHCDITHVEQWQ